MLKWYNTIYIYYLKLLSESVEHLQYKSIFHVEHLQVKPAFLK